MVLSEEVDGKEEGEREETRYGWGVCVETNNREVELGVSACEVLVNGRGQAYR